MVLKSTGTIIGLGLLAHGVFDIFTNSTWWAYVPVYIIPAALLTIQMPRNATWRTLSALSIVTGGLYIAFLLWTFKSIESTATIKLEETRNLILLAAGTLFVSLIRLTQDKLTQPVHYIRSFIIAVVSIISFYALISYFPSVFYKMFSY